MKCITPFILLFVAMSSKGQNKKLKFEITTKVNFSVSSDKFKTENSSDNNLRVSYPSTKKWENPFYNILGIASLPITNHIDIGLGSGLYLFNKETHYLVTLRTFVAIPIQSMFDFHLNRKEKSNIGIRLLPGILFYKIDDFVIKFNNAFVLDGEIYYKISPRSKFQIGWNQIVENGKMDFVLSNTNSEVKRDFSINRSAVYLGYTILIN